MKTGDKTLRTTGATGGGYRIDPAPRAAGDARRFVRRTLSGARLADEVIDTVELLTSELVTNIILHAGVPGELTVRVLPATVRVEVRDEDAVLPRLQARNELAESGRGLLLVDAMAVAWGVEPGGHDGKTVWFEVGTTPCSPTRPGGGATSSRHSAMGTGLPLSWSRGTLI